MKTIKKLGVILLALTLLTSLATIALADANVTINQQPGANHTYVAYQIFTGNSQDDTKDDQPIGDITWGDGIDSGKVSDFVQALKDDATVGTYFVTVTDDAASVAEALSKISDEDELLAFARVAKTYFTEKARTLEDGTTTLPLGYYIIVDTTDVEGAADAKNDIILQVTHDVTINAKYDVPSSDKKVKDSDDTAGTVTDWGTSADWDMDDDVPFQLSAVISCDNYDSYEKYSLSFVDTMSAGLSYNGAATIYWVAKGANATDPNTHKTLNSFTYSTKEYDGTEDEYEGGNVLTWTCEDIKAAGVTEGATVYVEYTAKLTGDAVVIGEPGNPNKSHIVFSNNPEDASGKGETPDNEVIVYTFELNVNKVDQNEDPLKGAEFTLYKLIPNVSGESYSDTQLEGVPADKAETHHWNDGTDMKVDANGTTFSTEGIDDGTYKLVETKVPDGYNKAEDIVFVVTAGHDDKGNVTDLTFDGLTNPAIDTKDKGATTTVKNQQGLTLPETGGIGTTIFYVLGGVMVLGAAVLLVTKKRMSKADD